LGTSGLITWSNIAARMRCPRGDHMDWEVLPGLLAGAESSPEHLASRAAVVRYLMGPALATAAGS